MKRLKVRFGAPSVFALAVLLVFALVMPGIAGEKAGNKVKKDHVPGAYAAQIKTSDGTNHPEAVSGTAWVIYDDGSREAWGGDFVPGSGAAAGNKFTSTWGTFYCDIMSAYAIWTGTGSSLYFSMWTSTANSGSDLAGNNFNTFSGLAASGSGWVQMDGSTSAIGFIGNPASVFSNTAWLGVYITAGGGPEGPESPQGITVINDVGIDTNGPGSHGFYVDSFTGTGYNEQSWNAMVRARFNGDNVPVELMTFTAE